MTKCLFCESDKIIKHLIYKTDYAPCPVCKCERINTNVNTYNDVSDPQCVDCRTSAPHEYWPKKTPDQYYYECDNCNAKIYGKS